MTLALVASPGAAQGRAGAGNPMPRIEALEQSVQAQGAEIERLKEQLEPPVEVHLPAVARGSYRSDGTPLSAGAGYIVGDIRGDVPSFAPELRNFFVFDLTPAREAVGASLAQTITVVEADLLVGNPATGFASTGSDIETYNVNRAGLTLFRPGPSVFDLIAGTAGTSGFTDLADGPGYGSYVVSARASNPDQVTIRLTRSALHDMTFRANLPTDGGENPSNPDSRLFGIGGNIASLNEQPDNEYLFSGSSTSPVTLVLKVRVEPAEEM